MGFIVGLFLVAITTSLGWAARGEWGSWWGETVPGALAGMALWLAFGQTNNAWQMLAFGGTLAIAHTVGGDISYGQIIGYVVSRKSIFDVQSDGSDLRSPLFGLCGLFLVGGMIGFFPATALGLLMTDVKYGIGDLALWAVLATVGAFLSYKLIVFGLGFRLSPPRSDYWAATLGGSIGSVAFFFLWSGDLVVLMTAMLGWLGYGVGFSIGGLIRRRATKAGIKLDSWKWMEHSVGFFGGIGLGVSAVMMGSGLKEIPLSSPVSLVSILVVFWIVPYLILSDIFQDWTFRIWQVGTPRSISLLKRESEDPDATSEGWRCIVSRRSFILFQTLALASIGPFLLLSGYLISNWSGFTWHRAPFTAAIVLYTCIAILKFLPIQRDRQKLITQMTFLAMMLACLTLAWLT